LDGGHRGVSVAFFVGFRWTVVVDWTVVVV
jgi:hypothetical protein